MVNRIIRLSVTTKAKPRWRMREVLPDVAIACMGYVRGSGRPIPWGDFHGTSPPHFIAGVPNEVPPM
jgi:hypothetical protein